MHIFKIIVLYTAIYFLRFESLLFLIRAILSWITPTGEGKVQTIVYNLTEPLIAPFRKLFDKYGWFIGTPIDMPFMFSYITIVILETILPIFL